MTSESQLLRTDVRNQQDIVKHPDPFHFGPAYVPQRRACPSNAQDQRLDRIRIMSFVALL
jgi:hypothetical protein